MDNPDQEPAWINNYDEFVEELMINFDLYDQVTDAKVELEQLVMKDNHKATKFFINFYQISALLDYNNQALHRKAYLALPKRIKDELIHFDKPRNLDDLQDLVQKIDQRYWECQSEVSRDMLTVLKMDQKSDKMSKPNRSSDRKANLTPSTSGSGSKEKHKDKSKSGNQNQKKPDLMDKLGKDGKLTSQEHQQHLDNKLCLLCGKSGHMVCDCPKSTKARAAKALLGAYMHHTLNTSLIYFNVYSICSNFYQNIKNYSKIFFLIFLYFYSHFFDCHIIFF